MNMEIPTNHPRWGRQVELEREMANRGHERFLAKVAEARDKREGTLNPAVHALVRHQIEPLAQAVRELLVGALSSKPGRRATAARYLQLLEPQATAYITAKIVLDKVSIDLSAQRMAIEIGSAIEDEVRCLFYRQENKALVEAILASRAKRAGQGPGRRRQVRKALFDSMTQKGLTWDAWPEPDKLHVGWKCLELFARTAGVIEIVRTECKGRPDMFRVRVTEKADEWITNRQSMTELLSPAYLPCVVPPRPWTDPFSGGYWTAEITHLRLITGQRSPRGRAYLDDLRHVEMPIVYEAINAIQNTAWKINRRVYETLLAAWDAGLELGKLPPRGDGPRPPKPDVPMDEAVFKAWIEDDHHKAELKAWRQRAEAVSAANAKLRSKRIQVAKAIWVADMLKDESAIYFPHQLDFRGRVYAAPAYLSPQGADWAKALLTFAEGAPIEEPQAADWLAIHGANVWGFDKVSLKERVAWTLEHVERICGCADEPLANRWWTDAEKPWQFLAFCFEWCEFRRRGYGFVSRLPVALDGTCNGLQHFSAMLRDPIGGLATNLVPTDRPQDVYQRVADRVTEKLTLHARTSENPEEQAMAKQWLSCGITRKTTKRPVMVLPYGGTQHSCRKYLREHVVERAALGQAHPFTADDKDLDRALRYLSRTVWASIGDVVVAAQRAMKWLQGIAKVVSKRGMPLQWTTPAGFPVVQAYPDTELHRVRTVLHGHVVKVVLAEELPTLDVRRQSLGVAPNFVHSMDGAALMLSVTSAQRQGVCSFAMVHDSYATLATHTDVLSRALRAAFVDMYEQHDVLAEFREAQRDGASGAPLADVPASGALDIRGVLQSAFFFA